MDGGSRVAEVLKAQGVEFVFTLIGGHISPILVGCKQRDIRVIDMRHEVNTVFAADAVARLTGIPGVAIVTAGPGVSNTVTAVKNAQMAQSPLVVIGGATATMLRGRGSLQDIDQVAMMKPHVKWCARPNTLREVVPALTKAFEIAKSGVPGPVFVELAVDLLYDESIVREWYSKKTDKPNKSLVEHAQSAYIRGHLKYLFAGSSRQAFPSPKPFQPKAPTEKQLTQAAEWLRESQRPVLVLGSQTLLHPQRVDELVAAVEQLGIPVYLSGMGRGLLGKGHPLQFRHKRSRALKESDLAILCGVPNDFRLDYGSHVSRTKVISCNLSQEDLTKNRKPDLGILADPHTFVTLLATQMGEVKSARTEWFNALQAREDARNTEIHAMADEELPPINPVRLCQQLEPILSENSILVGDGGDFLATASYIVSPRKPLSWLDPGVYGTLGVGAGFAIGAKLVRPDADVWLLWGDGASGFSLMEFDTFARHGLSCIALVGNDACWSQIARDQIDVLGDDVGCMLAPTDYHVIAKGCGGKGYPLDSEDKIESTLKSAVRASRKGVPVLVNAMIGKSDFRKGSLSM